MDLPLPEGTQANFCAHPELGEYGVVTFARNIAAHLHQLRQTPTAVHYHEDGDWRAGSDVTRLMYQLGGHHAEVTVHHGDLALTVDGRALDLPFNPRDPAWAIAWKIHTHLDDLRRAMGRPESHGALAPQPDACRVAGGGAGE